MMPTTEKPIMRPDRRSGAAMSGWGCSNFTAATPMFGSERSIPLSNLILEQPVMVPREFDTGDVRCIDVDPRQPAGLQSLKERDARIEVSRTRFLPQISGDDGLDPQCRSIRQISRRRAAATCGIIRRGADGGTRQDSGRHASAHGQEGARSIAGAACRKRDRIGRSLPLDDPIRQGRPPGHAGGGMAAR